MRSFILTITFAVSTLAMAMPQGKAATPAKDAEPTTITIASLATGTTVTGPAVVVGQDGNTAAKGPLGGVLAAGQKGTLAKRPFGTTVKNAKGPGGVNIIPADAAKSA